MAAPIVSAVERPPARRPKLRWALVAAGVVVVVALVAAALYRNGHRSTRSEGELLPIPVVATGPVAAERTRSYDGELDVTATTWDVARTGADDQQLVVTFNGGSCGTYHGVARESAEAVEVTIRMVWPGGGVSCNAMAMRQSIGIPLEAPLGDRELGGAAVDDPIVIPGSELVSIDWPGGLRRATDEHLGADESGDVFTWTQRLDPGAGPYREAIVLSQERTTFVDDGALTDRCGSTTSGRTSTTELGDVRANVVECADGSVAVWWMLDGDRVSLVAGPDAPGMDPTTIVDLARTVRRGG